MAHRPGQSRHRNGAGHCARLGTTRTVGGRAPSSTVLLPRGVAASRDGRNNAGQDRALGTADGVRSSRIRDGRPSRAAHQNHGHQGGEQCQDCSHDQTQRRPTGKADREGIAYGAQTLAGAALPPRPGVGEMAGESIEGTGGSSGAAPGDAQLLLGGELFGVYGDDVLDLGEGFLVRSGGGQEQGRGVVRDGAGAADGRVAGGPPGGAPAGVAGERSRSLPMWLSGS
jgi:hypothetical protein